MTGRLAIAIVGLCLVVLVGCGLLGLCDHESVIAAGGRQAATTSTLTVYDASAESSTTNPSSESSASVTGNDDTEDGSSTSKQSQELETDDETVTETVDNEGKSYVSNELLVRLDASQDTSVLYECFSAEGSTIESIEQVDSSDDDGGLLLIRYEGETSPTQMSECLAETSSVEIAEPNYVFELAEETNQENPSLEATTQAEEDAGLATTNTNDPSASEQWEQEVMGVRDAWDSVRCEGEVTVAVIDSGVDADHPDLEANLLLDQAMNVVSRETGPDAVNDEAGHGTHVTGIIAAVANNSEGTAGSSYNANVLPIKATYYNGREHKLRLSDIIKAIDYIIGLKQASDSSDELKAIRVINMSLGSTDDSLSFAEAVQRANDAGILVVAAAGNSGSNTKYYPAAYDEVVAVAALKKDDTAENGATRYSISNYGDWIDLSAPGANIYSTKINGGYGTMSGTSMASPMVAAAAALVFAADEDATPAEVKAILEETALDLGESGWDKLYGAGEVQADDAVLAALGKLEPNPNPATPDDQTTDEQSMYRLYNPNSGEHFYTASKEERDNVVSAGWTYEGIAWVAPTTSDAPVYRLYNPNAGDHHYTTSADERDYLVSIGWNDEGIGWYSDDAETAPLYRLYNPNALAGAHHYTANLFESNKLVSLGWRFEGVGWYGVG